MKNEEEAIKMWEENKKKKEREREEAEKKGIRGRYID